MSSPKFKQEFCCAMAAVVTLSLVACSKEPAENNHHLASEMHDSTRVVASAAHHAALPGEVRVVSIEAGDEGFKPSRVELTKGQPTTLRFTRTSDKTCADKVVFPEIKVEKELPLNTPVDVVVPSDQSRTVRDGHVQEFGGRQLTARHGCLGIGSPIGQ